MRSATRFTWPAVGDHGWIRGISCVMLAWWVVVASSAVDGGISFCNDIAPLLLDRCVACHCAKKAEGGYRVDSYELLLKPGDSGTVPVGATGDDIGEVVRRLSSEDESERMPADSHPLTDEQISLFRRWVAEGARFDGSQPKELLTYAIPPRVYPALASAYSKPMPITALVFSPDGTELVTSGYHELLVWRVADGSLVRRFPNVGERVHGLQFSSDGTLLIVGCGEPGKRGEVRLFDYASSALRNVLARSADVVLDIAIHPHDSRIAVASADNLVRIVDITSSIEIRTLAAHADWVTAVAWSDDGTRLATASRDKSAKVFDATSGELLANYQGHGAPVRGVAFVPDGSQVVSAGADRKIHRWTIPNGEKVAEISVAGEPFKLTRVGNRLYVPAADHHFRAIDLSQNSIAYDLVGHADWVLAGANHVSSERSASGAFDGTISLWDMADGKMVRQWRASP